MSKRNILAIIAVFFTWSVMDFIMHNVILSETYAATAQLWRPMEEMKMGLIYLTGIVSAITFVLIYAMFFAEKSVIRGVQYGMLFGLGAGFAMGYGSYSVMPIPYTLAFVWFIGSLVEATVGGIVVGLIIKDQ